jgi:hypothetical protein
VLKRCNEVLKKAVLKTLTYRSVQSGLNSSKIERTANEAKIILKCIFETLLNASLHTYEKESQAIFQESTLKKKKKIRIRLTSRGYVKYYRYIAAQYQSPISYIKNYFMRLKQKFLPNFSICPDFSLRHHMEIHFISCTHARTHIPGRLRILNSMAQFLFQTHRFVHSWSNYPGFMELQIILPHP